jgi:hypothetical protein
VRYGPKYLLIGTSLYTDTLVLRALLEGLSTQGRHWGETITILDNGSLPGLEHEVEPFKFLEHRHVKSWAQCNIVLAFMDDLRHNRQTQEWLDRAKGDGIPAFVISTYHP